MSKIDFHLIYLRNGKLILSKKHYNSWHEIQNEYSDYMTDLSFSSCEDIIKFFENDFSEENEFPLSIKQILDFAESNDIIIST